MGLPENIPSRNQWTWLDIEAMGHETGFSHVAPVAVYETRDPSRDTYPIGGQLPLPLSNSHWHYAATWYALALILLGVYVMSMNPKQDKQTEDNSNAAQEIDPVARRGLYPEATD
jgi:cytochrome oxidase assembly protein ShyY1